MRKIIYEVIFLGFIGMLTAPNVAFGTTYYVSNSGNDSNSGLSLANAFQTIQHAADLMQDGDTALVANGTYAGFDFRYYSATSADPTAFIATGTSVIINDNGPIRQDGINIEECDYTIIDGFNVTGMTGNGNGIRIVTSNHCMVRNNNCDANSRGIFTGFTDDILIEHNTCSNSYYEHGIYVSNSSDRPIVRFNRCFENAKAGLHFNGDLSAGGDGIISDPEIYGNELFENNLGSAINCDGVVGAKIYNNLIYNNHSCQGIVLFQTDGAAVSSHARIYNNTIIVPTDGRWGILIQDGANEGTIIYNNIIYNQHATRGCIAIVNTTQFTSDYNIVNNRMSLNGDSGPVITLSSWQGNGFDSHSLNASSLSSLFIDPSNLDFHLSSTSPAINAGTNLVSSVLTTDFDFLNRPSGANFDIGCFEYQVSGSNGVELLEQATMTIFPNPAQDNFTILNAISTEILMVQVSDLTGKIIQQYSPSLSNMYDLSSVKSGLYFVSIITTDHQMTTIRILVD